MSKQPGTFLGEKAKLEFQVNHGKPHPEVLPTELPLGKIKLNPAVFQHRKPPSWISESHIKELAKAPEQGRSLTPITVWWDGKDFVCIDGHHRIAAYGQTDYKYQPIPVSVLKGTLDHAIATAAAGNTKDKLAMNLGEKRETAWRLTIGTDYSKARVAAASGVSESTVANMRRAMSTLIDMDAKDDLSEYRWVQALKIFKGEKQQDIDQEARSEEEAQAIAKVLAKHLPKKVHSSPEVFARALEIYDTRLTERLQEHWAETPDDDMEAR